MNKLASILSGRCFKQSTISIKTNQSMFLIISSLLNGIAVNGAKDLPFKIFLENKMRWKDPKDYSKCVEKLTPSLTF